MDDWRFDSLSHIPTSIVDWLWYPYIPFGKITIIQGDPGEGKTTLALNIAAILSRGERLPTEDDYPYKHSTIKTIYQTAEDGLSDTVKPRLEAASADCDRIYTIMEDKEPLHFCDERIEKTIIETGARLLIMDPIQAYLGPKVDMHRANEVRPIMSRLESLANKHKCAIVLIGHMNKSDKKAKYKGLGSIDITAAARSVLLVGRVNNDKYKRYMLPIKSNLAPEGRAVLFRVGDTLIWDGFADENALMYDCEDSLPTTKLEEAERFLAHIFADGQPIASSDIQKMASRLEISERTPKEAKKALNIDSQKIGNTWYYVPCIK